MAARGSPEWYRERREGTPPLTPPPPPRPLEELIAEAVERLKRLADERDGKTA